MDPFGPVEGYESAYRLMRADRLADGAYASAISVLEDGGPNPHLRMIRPTAVMVCASCIAEGRADAPSVTAALVDALGRGEDVIQLAELMAKSLEASA